MQATWPTTARSAVLEHVRAVGDAATAVAAAGTGAESEDVTRVRAAKRRRVRSEGDSDAAGRVWTPGAVVHDEDHRMGPARRRTASSTTRARSTTGKVTDAMRAFVLELAYPRCVGGGAVRCGNPTMSLRRIREAICTSFGIRVSPTAASGTSLLRHATLLLPLSTLGVTASGGHGLPAKRCAAPSRPRGSSDGNLVGDLAGAGCKDRPPEAGKEAREGERGKGDGVGSAERGKGGDGVGSPELGKGGDGVGSPERATEADSCVLHVAVQQWAVGCQLAGGGSWIETTRHCTVVAAARQIGVLACRYVRHPQPTPQELCDVVRGCVGALRMHNQQVQCLGRRVRPWTVVIDARLCDPIVARHLKECGLQSRTVPQDTVAPVQRLLHQLGASVRCNWKMKAVQVKRKAGWQWCRPPWTLERAMTEVALELPFADQ